MIQNLFEQSIIWDFIIGVNVTAAGLASFVLLLFRKKKADVLLLTFGMTSLLYGIRLLIQIQLNQYVNEYPPLLLIYISAFITYTIPVPLSVFLLQLFGKGRGNLFLWIVRFFILFAMAGIVSDLIQAKPFSLVHLNNVFIVIWTFVFVLNVFLPGFKISRKYWIVLAGFLLFGLFALNENLVDLGILPWHWKYEPAGFVFFLISLGIAASYQFFKNEKQLIAVQQEMKTASEIQLSILPVQMPSIEGLNIAARYIPMSKVAGDFYDIVQHDNSRINFIVADVSGHGVGAALIASMIKVVFASQTQITTDPAQILDAMNRILCDKMENNFATAGCLCIDITRKTLLYSGAGHPPLLLWKKEKQKIYELCENGFMLGPFPDETYSNIQAKLDPGDRIILYTDGITEASNNSGAFFGSEAFKNFILSNNDVTAEQFSDLFLKHLFAWTGNIFGESLDDDLTLVVIDIT